MNDYEEFILGAYQKYWRVMPFRRVTDNGNQTVANVAVSDDAVGDKRSACSLTLENCIQMRDILNDIIMAERQDDGKKEKSGTIKG